MSYGLLPGHLLILPERTTLSYVLQYQPKDIRSADIRPKEPGQISILKSPRLLTLSSGLALSHLW